MALFDAIVGNARVGTYTEVLRAMAWNYGDTALN